jgi:hypothetical protein
MMAERLLLVVEGPGDKDVISAIRDRHDFKPQFKVEFEGGYETLRKRLSPRLKPGGDLERLGIVVDADTDATARWQSFKGVLERSGYANIPDQPDPTGTVVDHAIRPRVGVWIMPDNALPGMIEDFLAFLAPENDSLIGRARACLENIPVEERRFPVQHHTKALIHTWLAWQKEPGQPFYQAITKRYFEAEGPRVSSFLAWLTRLFA